MFLGSLVLPPQSPQSRCSERCPPGSIKKILNVSCCYTCIPCHEGTYSDQWGKAVLYAARSPPSHHLSHANTRRNTSWHCSVVNMSGWIGMYSNQLKMTRGSFNSRKSVLFPWQILLTAKTALMEHGHFMVGITVSQDGSPTSNGVILIPSPWWQLRPLGSYFWLSS